jgi:iron complex outermembrane receptor protein
VAAAVARTVAIGSLAACPLLAFAQEGATLEEIIVTAERRATSVQETPLSIIALSTETLENRNVRNIDDLTLLVPNVAIQPGRGGGTNTPTFLIRGVSGGGGATGERGVGLYVDNVYVPRTTGSIFRVFDMERIEVLRGPQGTLFGRNSTGGAIRLFTKQPTQEFESYVKATFGNFSRTDFTGMVNVPIGETFAVRGQGAYLKQDGFVERGSQMLGGSEEVLGRLQLAWTPNENFRATLAAMYSDSKSDGTPNDIIIWDMNPDLNFQGNFADWLGDALELAGKPRPQVNDDPTLLLDDYTMPDYCFVDDFNPDWDPACELRNDNRYFQTDLALEWTINENNSLTSTTGYSSMDHRGNTDWQMLGFEFRPDDVSSDVFYQELILNSALFGGKVDLATGVNFFHEDSESPRNPTLTRWGSSTFNPQAANGNAAGPLRTTADTLLEQTTKAYGIFASATWRITDKLNFTGGGRYSYDEKDYLQTRYAQVDFVPAPGTTSTTVTTKKDWDAVDWRATLDYTFVPGVMAYATASKAHKAGAIAYTVLQRVPGDQQSGDFIEALPPEEVVNYELGMRMTFLNNRLRINPTGYYMEWSDRQAARNVSCVAEGPEACPLGFRVILVNSGDVDIWGYELDMQAVLTDNLVLDGALGVTDYRLHDEAANGGPNLYPAQPSPTWNVGATWTQPTENYGSFMFNVSYSYVASQSTYPTDEGDSAYQLPSYGVLGARLQWTSRNGRNLVTLYGNNLTDESYGTFGTAFGGGFWDANPVPASGPLNPIAAPPRKMVSVTRARPLEYGITLQHNF